MPSLMQGEPLLSGDDAKLEHFNPEPLAYECCVLRLRTFVITLLLGCLILLGLHSVPRRELSRSEHDLDLGSFNNRYRNPAYLIKARHGAVASENEMCSKIGVEILKAGGNAVDSAIGTTFCIGTISMFSSGLGGGGLMTVRIPPTSIDGHSEVYTIDFRETAPGLVNRTIFQGDPEQARFGGLSVGVPGELRGLEEAHRRWGKLPWSQLLKPSIELAKGWKVGPELAKRITWFPELMLDNPDWSAIFAPNGYFLKEGETIRRTNLSRTLQAISDYGADALYKGPIADAIIRKVQATGGILSHTDLLSYTVKVDRALRGTYRGWSVYTTHAPTSGPVLLHMLNLVENFPLHEQNTLNVHRIVEILKFGFAARTKIGDPDYLNSTGHIDAIPTKAYSQLIIANVTDDRTHPSEYYQPEHDIKIDHGTSHTSVIDKDGMAVALTSTINFIFGSQVLDPETGIILNDEMDDFSIPGIPNAWGLWPSPYNYPEPGKRPLSSIASTIVEYPDGSFYLAIGGSGGSRIFGTVFQVILHLDWGLDVSQAIEAGRLHHQLYPEMLDVDDTYPSSIVAELRKIGHNVTVSDVNRVAAVVQAVTQQRGHIFAASDSRKNGIAAGY